MPALSFPLNSAPGLNAQENGGRLINAVPEKLSDGRVAYRRAPGLSQAFEILGFARCRGLINVNGLLYIALGQRLFSVARSSGVYTVTDKGSLPGIGPVTFARNNKPIPDVVCVADSVAYQIPVAGPPVNYPDGDVGSPSAVTFQGGYFVFTYGNARAQASGINSTSINTLDFAVAESKPDALFRPVGIGNDLLLCGTTTIEVWRNTGNETGFPFSYLDTIPKGIVSPWAIAGFEDEWAGQIIFVANDSSVYRLNGYTPQRVSTHEIERRVEAVSDKSTIECTVFMSGGHAFWCMSCPNWTWVYDLTTGSWHERMSYNSPRWRGSFACKVFDRWLIGDVASGKVWEASDTYQREGNDPLVARVTSAVSGAFPARARINRLDIDMVAGVGLAPGEAPIQTNPRVSVSWSLDGGYSFGSPVLREFGAQGRSNIKPIVHNLGLVRSKGLQVEIECSDPVPFTLFGADAVAQQRAR